MNKQTALRLLKDLNQNINIYYNGEYWAEIDEESFFIVLKNYVEVE